ncbi:MAG: hypothetical protein JO010_04785 [Alphaproteobacteria bacterium]|nr:hypothetical protein [Alphaproteobacteria bacterium]
MIGTAYTVSAAPLISWWALGALGAAALAILGIGLWRRARGIGWRILVLAALFTTLLNPALIQEQRDPQRDVAVVVVDDSPSQRIGERARYTQEALQHVTERLGRYKDLDIRVIHAGQPDENAALADSGTRLFAALGRTLGDVPRQRLAGIVMITDGEVHDVPAPDRAGFDAPLHVLLSGRPNEGDRRLVVEQAPSFGLVGKDVELTLRVEDLGTVPNPNARARVTLRKDGGQPTQLSLPIGTSQQIAVPIDHGGQNIVELEVEAGPQELTLDNNRAAVVINGVRDRLRVLLVSGEPHAGERTWRNILKSDPMVDLVHFTILRPPEKQDGTPIRELSLIAFPIRELFDVKLDQFDLIIFDRYHQRGVLPMAYLDNVARYVENGGALLVAAGPDFGTVTSLYRTPLGAVLPAEPSGRVIEQGFRPRVTAVGERHPVTAELPGDAPDANHDPAWGRWFRGIEAVPRRGDTVMSGANGQPLLVLDRVGKGRVAQLLSDEMWLWTRGFEGGGPQAELLRRLAYWLMQEPDLEENDLRATVDGNRLVVVRQSLDAEDRPVRITGPDGLMKEVKLSPTAGGRSTATLAVKESGLYRITDGQRTTLAAAGSLNPLELSDVRTTADKLAPVVKATGGGIFWVGPGPLPDVRRVAPEHAAAGRNWLGMRANGDYIVTGLSETPLLPAALALLLILGTLMAAWRREGR